MILALRQVIIIDALYMMVVDGDVDRDNPPGI